MLRNLLIAITKAFKWFVGWPRPVLVPKFKTGCEVWYSASQYDEEAEGGAAIGTVEIVKVDRTAEKINYLIKTNRMAQSGVKKASCALRTSKRGVRK